VKNHVGKKSQAQKQVVLTPVLYSFGHRTGHIRKILLSFYIASLGLRSQILVFEMQILEELFLGESSPQKATVVTEILVLLAVFGRIIVVVYYDRR